MQVNNFLLENDQMGKKKISEQYLRTAVS